MREFSATLLFLCLIYLGYFLYGEYLTPVRVECIAYDGSLTLDVSASKLAKNESGYKEYLWATIRNNGQDYFPLYNVKYMDSREFENAEEFFDIDGNVRLILLSNQKGGMAEVWLKSPNPIRRPVMCFKKAV